MTDREIIESALEQVQAGDLSAETATQIVLDTESSESLSELIQRLGPPPADVVAAWCEQMRAIAAAQQLETRSPLPEIELKQWSITGAGELLWLGRRWTTENDPKNWPSISTESQQTIDRFRSDWTRANVDAVTSDESAQTTLTDTTRSGQEPGPSAPSPRISPNTKRNLGYGAIAVTAITLGYILFRASQTTSSDLATTDDSPAPAISFVPATQTDGLVSNTDRIASTGNRPADVPNTNSVDDSTEGSAPALETFDEISALADTTTAAEPPLDDGPNMSLDAIMPAIESAPDVSATPADPHAIGREATTDSTADNEESNSSQPQSDALLDDRPEAALASVEASPQVVRESTVMSVQLGELGETGSPVSLADRSLSEPELDFPCDVSLVLRPRDRDWIIQDIRKDITIAMIRSSDQATDLLWSKIANQSTHVSSLIHGRIVSKDGSTIFLRPQIEAEAWQFRFDRPDQMPTWDLGYAVPPQATRLAAELELPDGIDVGWIEPIDPTKLRRSRGIAVITPAGEEEIALGVRLDLQCNRKLSARIRFAARLDPLMNWQLVSTSLLNQFAEQLADRARLIAAEGDRLANVYRNINRKDAKAHIARKQRNNRKLATEAAKFSTRVARLQSLLARLEAEAAIGFRVWVDWPDTEQLILVASNQPVPLAP